MREFVASRAKRYADPPENLESERCRKKLDDIISSSEGYKVNSEYNHDDVRKKLIAHFGIKCVYCETSPIASSTFRIDHFRPKKNIFEDPTHSGYYWLGYEWSNLLQSCQLCNGKKSNHFPLEQTSIRVNNKTQYALAKTRRRPDTKPLLDEQRLLLHPELDDVEKHFYFNASGEILSDTDKGNTSIMWYDLQRDSLIGERKKINDELLSDIKEELKNYEEDYFTDENGAKNRFLRFMNRKFRELLLKYNQHVEYSLFYFNIFDKFESFVIANIQQKEYKDLLLEAYRLYKYGGGN